MTLTRTRRKAQIIGAVIAVVAVGLFTVSQLSRSTFPGTDVEHFNASTGYSDSDCHISADRLEALVALSDLIVVGTVTSDSPIFEPIYGTDLPREVDGELPARKGDYLSQSLELDIEQVLSGTMPESLVMRGAGWQVSNNSDTWLRSGANGNPHLSAGDRAVVPLFLDAGAAPDRPVYNVSCTGAFVIDDGMVSARPDGRQFKDDRVYSMSEQELIAAIKRYAG